MKLVSGVLLLMGAEQAYAHANLISFPNHAAASQVLLPTSLIFFALGSLLFVWGLLTETRGRREFARELGEGRGS